MVDRHRMITKGRVLLIDGAVAGFAERHGFPEMIAVDG